MPWISQSFLEAEVEALENHNTTLDGECNELAGDLQRAVELLERAYTDLDDMRLQSHATPGRVGATTSTSFPGSGPNAVTAAGMANDHAGAAACSGGQGANDPNSGTPLVALKRA